MTTPNLLDELDGVVKFLLGEGELNGRWFGDEPPVTASGLKRRYWWRDDLRKAHTALADMAKRMEAAERDAAGEREESWEVWQDGMCVAGSDSLADSQHYMTMYGQDGPAKVVHVVTYRSDVIETLPAEQLAIDATQEGEG